MMRRLTRYFCVKKVFKVTGLTFVIIFVVASVTVWNFTQDSKSSRTKNMMEMLSERGIHIVFPQNGSQPYINDSRIIGNGFDRAKKMQDICLRLKPTLCGKRNRKASYCRTENKFRVDFNKQQSALFCPMCKMASTFWTRVFRMMDKNGEPGSDKNKMLRTPYDIKIAEAPQSNFHYDAAGKVVHPNEEVDFKFLFVRDPFSMLFATYVDKIIGPNPVYWGQYGTEVNNRKHKKNANICGADISFEDFLNHVIHTYNSGKYLDCHFAKYSVCNPCKINYEFIGKMETFKDDTYDILTIFNQTDTIEVFEQEYDNLHAIDAIKDSVTGPFQWREEIIKCIPWHDALKRIWRKLQIRGVLGLTPFPLPPKVSKTISKNAFIKVLVHLRKKSTPSERKALKRQAYFEAYKSVSKQILDGIKEVYKEEFQMFGYDNDPLRSYEDFNPYVNVSLVDILQL